jgi:hypothetical protein
MVGVFDSLGSVWVGPTPKTMEPTGGNPERGGPLLREGGNRVTPPAEPRSSDAPEGEYSSEVEIAQNARTSRGQGPPERPETGNPPHAFFLIRSENELANHDTSGFRKRSPPVSEERGV